MGISASTLELLQVDVRYQVRHWYIAYCIVLYGMRQTAASETIKDNSYQLKVLKYPVCSKSVHLFTRIVWEVG